MALDPSETPPSPEQPPKGKWFHRIWFVVAMLVTVGPFGFPLLWKSPHFSRQLKWVLTILFTVITVAATWGMIETVKLVIREVKALQASMS